jgi:transcriptional regulator with XRE-family HTH domain
MVSEIGRMIDQYADRQRYRPSDSQIARELGVTRAVIGQWRRGAVPSPENLRRLATLIDVPYSRLVDAVMVQLGYYPKVGEGDVVEPAPNTSAPLTAEQWDETYADLYGRGLLERTILSQIGPRPSAVPGAGEVVGVKPDDTAGHSGSAQGSLRRA